MIIVPRNKAQAGVVRTTWPALIASAKVILPDHVEDGLNLIWYSDLVISGGGTMNREAAALDVPVYSIFRGPMGAVDRFLAAQGRLVVIANDSDVRSKIVVAHRTRPANPASAARPAMMTIVSHIVSIVEKSQPARQVTQVS
jgi:predicted glycosyltransferase